MRQYTKSTITAIFILLSMSCAAFASTAPPLKTAQDKLSYSLGMMTGRTFAAHGVAIDPDVFAFGFKQAILHKKSLLTEKEMNQIVENFQKQDQQKARRQLEEISKTNLQNSNKFLAKNKTKKGIVTLPSGLQFQVIKPGKGPHPKASDSVVVNYQGSLIDGTVFDSSFKRGRPVTFPVNGVIKGWQQALQMMSPGAVWKIYLPPSLAYGDQNYPPMIGPNQALCFTIELIAIKK